MNGIKKIVRNTTFAAVLLSVMIALLPPFFYFFLGHQYLSAVLETEAEMNGLLVSQIISSSPEYWRYEHVKLEEFISKNAIKRNDETRCIFDEGGVVIAKSENELKQPVIARSHNLYDSGNVVGRLEISRPLRPLLVDTLLVGLFSFLLGFSVFATLKIFPLRALSTALRSVYEEKEKAQSILNNIPDIAWLKDRDDRYITANGPFCQICGVNAGDLPGKTDLDLWPPDIAERYRADDREVMATRKSKYIEEPIVDRDGKMTWILTIKTPIFNKEGEVIGTTGIARDFTERKRMEEALRASEERYRGVVDNIGIGIALISPNMEILSLNRQMQEWSPAIDVSQRPICFRSFNRPPREEICSYCPTVRTLRDGRVYESVTETPVESGIINFRVVSSPLKDSEGNVIAAIELVEDITVRKKAEEEIRRLNEELELKVSERTKQLVDAQDELVSKEKLAILGQLSGSVGHELRNPMGVISNAVYFLETIMPDADETVREYLGIIRSEVNNSQRIITDLLDFTRTKTPQTKVMSVDELITQGVGKCTVPADVALRVEMPAKLPRLKVDPLQMGQVFQNLVTNAVQSMHNGGSLVIWAEEDSKSGVISISIADTGEGIAAENMSRLFQPLFTAKARGIGLGLTVVKNLTEANGGRIEVESQQGKGTTVRVILPCHRE